MVYKWQKGKTHGKMIYEAGWLLLVKSELGWKHTDGGASQGGSEQWGDGGVADLPGRGTAEDEGGCGSTAGGKEERGGKVVRTGSEEGERKRTGDARGSEVLCLWHGSRFREAGEDAQHGSILSQETLVHPPQALDLSQSWESLHRGGQRDPERGRHTRHARRRDRERERKKACAENRTQAHTYTHTHTTYTHKYKGKMATFQGYLRKGKRCNMQTNKRKWSQSLLEFVLIKLHRVELKCYSVCCLSRGRTFKFMGTYIT